MFAALDVTSGQIIDSIHRRHRATEFKKFLIKIVAALIEKAARPEVALDPARRSRPPPKVPVALVGDKVGHA